MHRSGTSILTECLQALGLFVGWRLDSHFESTFHQRLNRRLSAELGGQWSNPQSVYDTLAAADAPTLVEPLRTHLDGPGAFEYWGRARSQRRGPETPWGWKDPRNGYLLPIWRAVYPDLRVVFIERDPLECAESVLRRSLDMRAELSTRRASGFRRFRESVQGHPIVADAVRALDASSALGIAHDYQRVHAHTIDPTDPSVLSVSYDDLVDSPASTLMACARHCGLEPAPRAVDEIAGRIRRAEPDRTSPTWQAIARAADEQRG